MTTISYYNTLKRSVFNFFFCFFFFCFLLIKDDHEKIANIFTRAQPENIVALYLLFALNTQVFLLRRTPFLLSFSTTYYTDRDGKRSRSIVIFKWKQRNWNEKFFLRIVVTLVCLVVFIRTWKTKLEIGNESITFTNPVAATYSEHFIRTHTRTLNQILIPKIAFIHTYVFH